MDTRIYSNLNLPSALERLHAKGFDVVELATSHVRGLSKEGVYRLAESVRELGVQVVQAHTPHGEYEYELASLDVDVYEKPVRKFEKWFEFCHRLGCRILVVHLPYGPSGLDEDTVSYNLRLRERSLKFLSKLERFSIEYDVKVAVENRLENVFGSRPQDLKMIFDSLSSEHIGVCFDVGHANVNGFDPAEFLTVLSQYVITTHLHDNNGRKDQHRPPLMGRINWPKLLSRFKHVGYSGPYIFEVASPKGVSADNIVDYCRLVADKFRGVLGYESRS